MAQVEHILTLDIGGSSVKYGICDLKGVVTNKGQLPTPFHPEAKVEDLLAVLKQIYDECSQKATFEGIAISAPGCIMSDGFMRTGGHLFYNAGNNLADLMENMVGMRPVLINDAKAAAEAELWIGALQNVTNGAALLLGTGLGGALIINGQVLNGPHGSAGELSPFEMLGRVEYERGSTFSCAANTVSTTGLLLRVCKELNLDIIFDDEKHERVLPIDGRQVFAMLEAGDERVSKALEEFALDAGFLIFNLCTVVDLEKIAIGGGISSQPKLIEAIRRGVDKIWAKNLLTKAGVDLIIKPEIVVCKYQNDANLIGAMHNYLVRHGLI